MATPQPAAVDTAKLQDFMGKMVGDMGAALSGALVLIGDKLGLYRSLAEDGAATSAELAARTETAERYVREWLAAQAASGYVDYDKDTGRFSMTPEQAMALAHETSPVYLAGAFEVIASAYLDEPMVTDAFRSGKGVGWHEHHECLFRGVERFFRSGYSAFLAQDWLPALDGVVEKLARGAKVADVGCRHGASTILMAKAFPNSSFIGFDHHEPSIRPARAAALSAGVAANTRFDVTKAKTFPATAMISSPASTACTPWAIPRALPRTSARRSNPTAALENIRQRRYAGYTPTRTAIHSVNKVSKVRWSSSIGPSTRSTMPQGFWRSMSTGRSSRTAR
jgi:hypothetical protein